MVALAILLAVIAGVSTLWDFQTKASAQGNGNNNQASEEEDEGNGNGNQVSAGELCGFAWGAEGASVSSGSRNGVGWVSFNSQDCDPNDNGAFDDGVPGCPSNGTTFHEYHVSVNSGRYLEGYAWSSNLGWLKFDESFMGPSGAGNSTSNHGARIQNESGNSNVRGWARFCEGTDPDNCSGTSRTDGWDGWVSLEGSGTQSGSYGVTYTESTQKFAGYSWGGPVVGWLKWDQTDGRGVRYCMTPNVTPSLFAVPSSGAAPLSPVVLTAEVIPADSNAKYRFACTDSDSLYPAPPAQGQSSSSYTCTNKYPTANTTYTARVEVTSNSQTATAYTTVTTDSDGGPGPSSGALSVSCQIVENPPYVIGSQVAINRPAVWRADATPTGSIVAPYTYTFEFDDNNDGTFGGAGDQSNYVTTTSNLFADAERVYRLLGRKSVRATVQDSTSPTAASAVCAAANVTVVVTPRIIEF